MKKTYILLAISWLMVVGCQEEVQYQPVDSSFTLAQNTTASGQYTVKLRASSKLADGPNLVSLQVFNEYSHTYFTEVHVSISSYYFNDHIKKRGPLGQSLIFLKPDKPTTFNQFFIASRSVDWRMQVYFLDEDGEPTIVPLALPQIEDVKPLRSLVYPLKSDLDIIASLQMPTAVSMGSNELEVFLFIGNEKQGYEPLKGLELSCHLFNENKQVSTTFAMQHKYNGMYKALVDMPEAGLYQLSLSGRYREYIIDHKNHFAVTVN